MAKLLREISRHSGSLSNLISAIEKLEASQTQQIAHTRTVLDRAQNDNRPSWRLPALGLLAVFAVGVAFGGFFVS
jgi:uncharacterized protein involved in exopolysaccharide biosynthesis